MGEHALTIAQNPVLDKACGAHLVCHGCGRCGGIKDRGIDDRRRMAFTGGSSIVTTAAEPRLPDLTAMLGTLMNCAIYCI
jgi:hypothetical protein